MKIHYFLLCKIGLQAKQDVEPLSVTIIRGNQNKVYYLKGRYTGTPIPFHTVSNE
jgi:hypothetical protein